jgi:hypothetical protein
MFNYLNQPFNDICLENFTSHLGEISCCGNCMSKHTASIGI